MNQAPLRIGKIFANPLILVRKNISKAWREERLTGMYAEVFPFADSSRKLLLMCNRYLPSRPAALVGLGPTPVLVSIAELKPLPKVQFEPDPRFLAAQKWRLERTATEKDLSPIDRFFPAHIFQPNP